MVDETFIGDVLYSDTKNKQKKLTVNSHKTVQPVAFMRLGLFVPKPRNSTEPSPVIDASELLSKLELARAEGYDNVSIVGPRLDMDTDFKVWIGIIHAFSKYGLTSNKITLRLTEFAKDCGFPSKRLSTSLRKEIHASLIKLRSKTISFQRGNDAKSVYATGLLKVGGFDAGRDEIILEADEKLWELYQFDHLVLMSQIAIKALPKKEAAQALYTFIESLPSRPAPISFERFRDRLNLTSEVKEQNRAIKTAISHLQKIGYLDADIVKKGKENYLIIHGRRPKLVIQEEK
ncbi:protein RepA [Salmonella enterica]|nr:protein RepA [Salmonella enterica]